MRINHNISSMHTQGSLFKVNRSMTKSLEKLSTGLRINRASDDAAGLGVSENLRVQTRGMEQALKNTQDAIALLNIADGALNEQADILQRMRELVVQAQNDTYTQTERDYMGQEFGLLMQELDRIATVTRYNGMQIFATPESSGNAIAGIYTDANGAPETAHKTTQSSSLGSVSSLGTNDMGSGHHFNMMVGANYVEADISSYDSSGQFYSENAANMITIAFGQMDSNTLFHNHPSTAGGDTDGFGLFGDFAWGSNLPAFDGDMGDTSIDFAYGGNGSLKNKLSLIHKLIDGDISDVPSSVRAILFGDPSSTSPTGLERVNQMRAKIGAMINRLEHSSNNLVNQIMNTQSAESLIRDTSFASETAEFTKNQIITQSSTAMLAQANTSPQMILQLLQ
jgi:flagellin